MRWKSTHIDIGRTLIIAQFTQKTLVIELTAAVSFSERKYQATHNFAKHFMCT